MAQRVLPGAYVSLNDLSQLPEGATALTVGYVTRANRGPVNELKMVTSPSDFLAKYTFGGKPALNEDPTFWSILKVLSRTNMMYVSRAANNPLYGGIILKKAETLGTVIKATTEDSTSKIYVEANSLAPFVVGKQIMVQGTTYKGATAVEEGKDARDINGYYTIESRAFGETETEVVVTLKDDPLPNGYSASDDTDGNGVMAATPGVGISSLLLNDITSMETGSKIIISGTKSPLITVGSEILIKGGTLGTNEGTVFTVEAIENDNELTVSPAATIDTGASIYAYGIEDPENLIVTGSNAMIITGIDPGAYNGDFAFDITSSLDDEDMVYRKGALVGGKECTFDTMILNVRNSLTGDVIETFLFSLDPEAKDISGNSLYVDNVVAGSGYIKIFHGTDTELPSSTVAGMPVNADGGSNGGEVETSHLEAALKPFEDKVVSVSILGNGCSTQAETKKFQQALMGIADTRKDCFVFLNNPSDTEKKTLNSDKAQAIVDYKKGDLANTSFYGCMYAPHVNTSDIYNGRDVKIGSEAVAIAGWLGIIDSLSYPYAYAGPRNGLVQGVTCDWKIGDMSGEAQVLNDASINYVAYDGKVGRYYMQCQNTLQVANSSMRNIGTVLNVLDIKEHFVTSLKEYLQLPITDDLRRDIVDTANDYLSPMEGVRFYNYLFQDTSSDFDIADNTLRYLLTIAPTAYAQKIYLVMNIVNATFDFSILQSL